MTAENRRDVLLQSVEQIRASARKLESEAVALHQIVRFDHQSPGAKEWTGKVHRELEELVGALHRFGKLLADEPGDSA